MSLHLARKQKLGIIVLLCMGVVVTAAGVVRTYYVWKSLMGSWDVTWYCSELWISACVEIDLAIVSRLLYQGVPLSYTLVLILYILPAVCLCTYAPTSLRTTSIFLEGKAKTSTALPSPPAATAGSSSHRCPPSPKIYSIMAATISLQLDHRLRRRQDRIGTKHRAESGEQGHDEARCGGESGFDGHYWSFKQRICV